MKDHTRMTPDELASEAKKLASLKYLVAGFMGFMVVLAVWGATHKGGFLLTIGLMAVALLAGSRYQKRQKNIRAELNQRDTTQ